ncbi:MAG: hypothetical protein C4518_15630 [Desulfobacteraceae bacterium]|nr:MAG: hypothetical protein C4518_15630 [Desulfobacteraceae bacterium]
MEIEYIGKLLPDGHISLPPDVREKFQIGEMVKVRLTKQIKNRPTSLSPQAQELIRMFEEAPDRGGYLGQEITREFIHDR